MVLQRDLRAPVFGTAAPGQEVVVDLSGVRQSCRADKNGKWLVRLPKMQAGGPFTLSVSGGPVIHNVYVGEVWLASGQSNMSFPESGANDAAQVLASPNPNVRMFTVGLVSTESPASDIGGNWQVAEPATVGNFSAVAYSFANEISRALGVTVGIIHSSWGGTPAESWTSRPALLADAKLRPMVENYLAQLRDFPARKQAYDAAMNEWISGRHDGSNEGFQQGWAYPILDQSDWVDATLPQPIETTFNDPNLDGAVWYRRTFELPNAWYGKSVHLQLGPIDDYDDTYVNATKVGQTKQDVENSWQFPRVYRIAPGVLRRGVNTIAIRVFDVAGQGGLVGSANDLKLVGEDGTTLPLAGAWKAKIERRLDKTKQPPERPFGPGNPWAPGGLYNGMIAPLIPYGIRGVIWYQGESNADRAIQYRRLFPTMIQDWRNRWGEGDFPFLFVQLANFTERLPQPGESQWAELREAQTSTLRKPNTGMAVIIDIGEAGDIHPKNKKEVGRRLALLALAKTYGRNVPHASPLMRRAQFVGGEAQVFFDNVGEGLTTSNNGPVRGFAVAGDDHVFHWADARISGSMVLASNKDVPHPIAVRYAWANNPEANLINRAGLPASPFRSDDWETGAGGK